MYYSILTRDNEEIAVREAESPQSAIDNLPAAAEHWLPLSAQPAELVMPLEFEIRYSAYQYSRRTQYKTREIFPRRLKTSAGKIWILKHHKMGILCTDGRFYTIEKIGQPRAWYR